MNQLRVSMGHVSPQPENCSSWSVIDSPVMAGLRELGVTNVELKGPPINHELSYSTLLTTRAVRFLEHLVKEFYTDAEKMLLQRKQTKLGLDSSEGLPDFQTIARGHCHGNWKVKPVPQRLMCRHVDLGDVSPSNTSHFIASLKSSAQGIQWKAQMLLLVPQKSERLYSRQSAAAMLTRNENAKWFVARVVPTAGQEAKITDFDDGHCPTWPNQLRGLYNVYQAVHNNIPGVPKIQDAPVLMLRPRAWNMVEHNMLVNGKEVPGPLFDFGLLMFHNARILLECQSGPFFYLSKLEGGKEAELWDSIFTWTEKQLHLPHGCIKACVLIENVLASFEMEEILYALRDHSAGLNCGIWDYSASFINKFGHRPEFVLPDRNKYVSMERHFLKSYMDLVVQTCHKRGCHATGGMAALLLPPTKNHPQYQTVLEIVTSSKQREIEAGVDGFMVYDLRLVQPMQELFSRLTSGENQHDVLREDVRLAASDLLLMPSGSVTLAGLRHNITVGILFIEAWLRGQGHYYLKGAVEDSATAEISRSQVWQWIRHQASIEDNNEKVTMATVDSMTTSVVKEMLWSQENKENFVSADDRRRLHTAASMFLEIVTKVEFPAFITTYLNLHHTFLKSTELVSEL